MENTIIYVKRDGLAMHLYQYFDFHRYEITFTVRVYAAGGVFIEKDFKSFAAACRYFNKECINRDAGEWVIW